MSKKLYTQNELRFISEEKEKGISWNDIVTSFKKKFGKYHTYNALRNAWRRHVAAPPRMPKILVLDIETAPILAFVWGLWNNNVGLNQIKQDWYILSWAAKWLGAPESEVMYEDQRNAKNIENDSKLLKRIWKLLDEADVVVTQNGVKFDIPKLNARFITHGYPPPSSFKQIDTYRIAKKHFGFTSNKLEYMTDKFCTKYKKSKHAKFSGFSLWKQCLAGNPEAWDEMENYNKFDILSLEELYLVLAPWDNTVNFDLYHDQLVNLCSCGSTNFKKNGYYYTTTGKFQRYRCECGKEHRDSTNLLSKEKKKTIKSKVVR